MEGSVRKAGSKLVLTVKIKNNALKAQTPRTVGWSFVAA